MKKIKTQSGEHQMITRDAVNRRPERVEAVFIPMIGSEEELIEAAYVAALTDPTPEGKVILNITKRKLKSTAFSWNIQESQVVERVHCKNTFVREGKLEVIENWVRGFGGVIHNRIRRIVDQIQGQNGIAVIVANDKSDLGVVYLCTSAVQ